MEMNLVPHSSIAIPVSEQSQVGEARRLSASLSSALRFSETLAGKVGIIVSELATNLMKHTPGGELIFRRLADGDRLGIEVLSIDKGAGFDFEQCLRDGYSSAGTPGTGLGSVQRLSSCFEVFSLPGRGTVLLTQIWDKSNVTKSHRLEVGTICLPLKGEQATGDAWSVSSSGYQHRILMVDGLGHGEKASEAALTAVEVFEKSPNQSISAVVESCHLAMRGTRGGALAIALLDFDRDLLRFIGIGNIAGVILDGDNRRNLVSQNGTVGLNISRVTEFQQPWSKDSLLILNSDGLASRWKLEDYPGLRGRHPSIVAGILYRDFHRERDDVTVLVARQPWTS